MTIPKIYSTLSIPEASYFELDLDEPAEIIITNGKAVFTFEINERFAAAKRRFDGGAEVNVRTFVDKMKNLKRRMHTVLMQMPKE